MMEKDIGEKGKKKEKKFSRKNSGKSFKSRPHDKAEKRKQRKEWLNRKREKVRQCEHAAAKDEETKVGKVKERIRVQQKHEPAGEEKLPVAETEGMRVQHDHEPAGEYRGRKTVVAESLSRGKKLLEMSRKRKNEEQMKPPAKVSKPRAEKQRKRVPGKREEKDRTQLTASGYKFKELNRDLLAVDETEAIGSGTFGKCFTAIYRKEYQVIVKEMKTKNSTKEEVERAKKEVLHEATILSELGDHPGIPHLFGVCRERSPFYLVLQYHAVQGRSVTLSKAVTTGVITSVSECVKILKQTGEILLFLHNKGYLHNDLKGNNVVLDGVNHDPILIDFGKSKKISKARLLKPKVDIKEASKRYPHIAPELHRGERQSTASDVYSFGALIQRVLKDGNFDVPVVKSAAKKCLSGSPGKRPELKDVLQEMEL